MDVINRNFFPSRNDVENTIRLLDKYQITSYNYPSAEDNDRLVNSIQNSGLNTIFNLLRTPVRNTLVCEGGEYSRDLEHTPGEWMQILDAIDNYPRPYHSGCHHFLKLPLEERTNILTFKASRVKLIEFLHSSGLPIDTANAWLQIREFNWEDTTRLNKLNTWDYIEAKPIFDLPLSLTESFGKWYANYSDRYKIEGVYGLCLSMYSEPVGDSSVEGWFCIIEERDGECALDRDMCPEFKKKYRALLKELRTTLHQKIYVNHMKQRRTS